jgi:hypothetical protein
MLSRIFILALLLASVHSYSKDKDLADADYCIDWLGEEAFDVESEGELVFDVRLVLVKKSRSLALSIGRQKPIPCVEKYHTREGAQFFLADTHGKQIFMFESLGLLEIAESPEYKMDIWIDGEKGYESKIIPIAPKRIKTLPAKIRIEFPDTVYYLIKKPKEYDKHNRKELLQPFMGKTINAEIWKRITCLPDIEYAEYRIKFRARITGECDSDFLNKRKKNR